MRQVALFHKGQASGGAVRIRAPLSDERSQRLLDAFVARHQLAKERRQLNTLIRIQGAHNPLLGPAHSPLHLQRKLFAFGRGP